MTRLLMFLAEHFQVILGGLGVVSAYFLNTSQQQLLLHHFDFLKEKLEKWWDFRKRHKTVDLYLTLIATLASAASFAPVIIDRWPKISGWWQTTHGKYPELLGWLLFVLALGSAFGLYELRKRRLYIYAYLEILVGVAIIALISFDLNQARMSIGVKLVAAIYAMIRGLVNRADARKQAEEAKEDNDKATPTAGQALTPAESLAEATA